MRFIPLTLASSILALAAGAASAADRAPHGASSLVLLPAAFEVSAAAIVPAGGISVHSGTRYEAIRHRPRSRGARSRATAVESPAQFHLGFLDPEGGGSGSFVAGMRGGPQLDPHIQIGGAFDWVHRSEDETVVAGDPYRQGNSVITPTRVLSRASSNLFPFHLFMQVSGDGDLPVIPFGGISGGYQLLLLSADDFATQTSYDATFGGWGWQAWLGAAIPLSGRSRISGEVYVNQGNPEREVHDLNGFAFRERVNVDGGGMRFGLQWGF